MQKMEKKKKEDEIIEDDISEFLEEETDNLEEITDKVMNIVESTSTKDMNEINIIQEIDNKYKKILDKKASKGEILYWKNEIDTGNLTLDELEKYYIAMKTVFDMYERLFNESPGEEEAKLIKELTNEAYEKNYNLGELEVLFKETQEYKDLLNKQYKKLEEKDKQDKSENSNILGGCSGTRFGCCPDNKTSKIDNDGSNCIEYNKNIKSVFVLGTFGIAPWYSNSNNIKFFKDCKWIWNIQDAQISSPKDNTAKIQYIYLNQLNMNIKAKLYVIVDNECAITFINSGGNSLDGKIVKGGYGIIDKVNPIEVELTPGNNLFEFNCKNYEEGPAGLVVNCMYNNKSLFKSDNKWVFIEDSSKNDVQSPISELKNNQMNKQQDMLQNQQEENLNSNVTELTGSGTSIAPSCEEMSR
jgi:hypothetical protein